MSNIYLLSALLIGAAFACQPGINAVAAKAFGSPYPATVLSIGITLIASSIVMFATKAVPTPAMVASLPWRIVFGGLIGLLVVAGGVVIVPVTGVALFFVCMIAGQLLGLVILDQIGAFGLQSKAISFSRIGGVILAFCAVLLVRYGP
jgi:transporter family-2 protein